MIEAKIDAMAFTANRWPPAADRPTVLFIHGSGGSGVLWRHQVDGLAEAGQHRGRGPAGARGQRRRRARDRIEDYARDLIAFIEAAALPRPIPCGLSIGGAVVLQLLLDAPELFLRRHPLLHRGAAAGPAGPSWKTIATDYDRFVDELGRFGAAAATDPQRLEPIVAATRRCPAEVTLGDFVACDRFDVSERPRRDLQAGAGGFGRRRPADAAQVRRLSRDAYFRGRAGAHRRSGPPAAAGAARGRSTPPSPGFWAA